MKPNELLLAIIEQIRDAQHPNYVLIDQHDDAFSNAAEAEERILELGQVVQELVDLQEKHPTVPILKSLDKLLNVLFADLPYAYSELMESLEDEDIDE